MLPKDICIKIVIIYEKDYKKIVSENLDLINLTIIRKFLKKC